MKIWIRFTRSAQKEDLDQIYKECPKRDVKIIIGDLNTKIGQEEML